MEVLDVTASPTASAGPQTPKSAKNVKKRGRWALGAESAVGEFSKRARHSLSTLCTLRSMCTAAELLPREPTTPGSILFAPNERRLISLLDLLLVL